MADDSVPIVGRRVSIPRLAVVGLHVPFLATLGWALPSALGQADVLPVGLVAVNVAFALTLFIVLVSGLSSWWRRDAKWVAVVDGVVAGSSTLTGIANLLLESSDIAIAPVSVPSSLLLASVLAAGAAAWQVNGQTGAVGARVWLVIGLALLPAVVLGVLSFPAGQRAWTAEVHVAGAASADYVGPVERGDPAIQGAPSGTAVLKCESAESSDDVSIDFSLGFPADDQWWVLDYESSFDHQAGPQATISLTTPDGTFQGAGYANYAHRPGRIRAEIPDQSLAAVPPRGEGGSSVRVRVIVDGAC